MSKRLFSSLLGLLGLFCGAQSSCGARSTDEQVKSLATLYNNVEGQLERSALYVRKQVSATETVTEQAWINGAGDLIKFMRERSTASGRESMEWFARNFELAEGGMFLLTRKETALPEEGTRVEESRRYFGEEFTPGKDGDVYDNGVLLRELTKSAEFKSGEALDTVHTPNRIAKLPAKSKKSMSDEEREVEARLFSTALETAAQICKDGAPIFDPFAHLKGDADRFRVIHGSASPDGRYAIAIGFARRKIDWEEFIDADLPAEKVYTAEDQKDLRIYVVELGTARILGETGGEYFGTRRRYNHRECLVSWSPDSTKFVELSVEKWNYVSCRVGQIASGPKLVGMLDLGKTAEKAAFGFLASRKNGTYRKHGREISIAITVEGPTNDGFLGLRLWGSVPKSDLPNDVFVVSERLRLRNGSGRLQLEALEVRYASEN